MYPPPQVQQMIDGLLWKMHQPPFKEHIQKARQTKRLSGNLNIS